MLKMREYTHEEYLSDLAKERKQDGLYTAVKRRCDLINDQCSIFGYVEHRYRQVWLCEILDLIGGECDEQS